MALLVGNIAASPLFESASSLKDSDNYHEKRGNTVWVDLDDEVKEASLIKAADYIKATYGTSWSLATKAASIIPYNLGQANCELALIASKQELITPKKRGKKKVKVGPIEVEYDAELIDGQQFTFASLLIAPLLASVATGTVTMQRLYRS